MRRAVAIAYLVVFAAALYGLICLVRRNPFENTAELVGAVALVHFVIGNPRSVMLALGEALRGGPHHNAGAANAAHQEE